MKISPARRMAATAANAARLPIFAAALALTIAGCSGSGGVEIGVLEPSTAPAQPEQLAEVRQRRQVQSVERLEFGAIHDGRMMTAWGHAPEGDWFSPRLEIRREGLPGPDGFIEFDLVAAPPALNGGETGPVGTLAQRRIRADVPLLKLLTDGATGVRVYAQDGAVAERF